MLGDINYCIEYNGDYYHANPNIYNENFLNKHMNLTAKEIWDRDEIKIKYMNDIGFKTDIIWEYDHDNNLIKLDDFMDNIMNQLKLNI